MYSDIAIEVVKGTIKDVDVLKERICMEVKIPISISQDTFLQQYTLAKGIHITNRGAFVYTSENSRLENKKN